MNEFDKILSLSYKEREALALGVVSMFSDDERKEMDEVYKKLPKQKDDFDDCGLRYDIEHLNELGLNICLLPIQYMSNYVDIVTKTLIDSNDEEFINSIIKEGDIKQEHYDNTNATGMGNMAYIAINCLNFEAKELCKKNIYNAVLMHLDYLEKVAIENEKSKNN